MEGNKPYEKPTFSSPEEEIQHLRAQVAEKERALEGAKEDIPPRQEIVSDEIKQYARNKPEEVLSPEHQMKIEDIENKVLHLKPGHDEKIEEFVGIMEEKGLRNTLSVVEKLDNPHLEDDFHRFLVQYFVELGTPPGIKEGTPLFKALQKKLFEITLLRREGENERSFTELVSGMEQFYAGMLSMDDDKGMSNVGGRNSFTMEIAQSNKEEEIVFYCAVPRVKERIFEKQLLAVFPDARLKERKDDYNIFSEGGVTLAAEGKSVKHSILPIKIYDSFDQDPLLILLNAFSKIKREGEGAAVQIVISPAGHKHNDEYKEALTKIQNGISLKEATQSFGATVAKEIGGTFKEMVFGAKKEGNEKKEEEEPKVDEDLVENIKSKLESPILDTNIRLVTSAPTKEEAEMILSELESAFNQYTRPDSNGISFKRPTGGNLKTCIRDFTFRYYDKSNNSPLNLRELTTVFHLPVTAHSINEIRDDTAKQSGAPTSISGDGVLLGVNDYQGRGTNVHFKKEDRVRHFYVIGQTGTGKTSLLKNMIVEDIANGDGVCFIDPHGSDVDDILANIPEERIDDVIYFDPAYTARPMGLNMLEYNHDFPEQKTFVVGELFGIFQKLYGGTPESMGPMFEQYFRNATQLVIEDPSSGSTLLEVSRVMSDEKFRKLKLSRCNNPIVKQFWEKIASKAGGEASLANIVPYITSKFDVFMSNDIMRPIIAQEHSAFDFRKIMDEKKILLINLSKGRLGDINSSLIGLIIVGKILMAALSRVDASEESRHDFYLYIDEFQNVTTDSIATILSEARKYRLGLNIAHQFIAQLDNKIKDAVFGNVGSVAAFRVGIEDAEFLEKQFAPMFSASDIMNLDNHNAYLKLLVNGQPSEPFNIHTLKPETAHPEIIEKMKQLSYKRYGRDRAEIEASISKRFGT